MSMDWWIDTPVTMEHLEAGLLTPEQQKRLAYMLKQKEQDSEATVESLVLSEVRRATLDHDQFHSPHEGWAVIREEVLEASNETGVLSDLCRMLDEKVRNDGVLTRHADIAQGIRDVAIRGIRELIQVAATAQRYIYACDHKCGEFAKLPGKVGDGE